MARRIGLTFIAIAASAQPALAQEARYEIQRNQIRQLESQRQMDRYQTERQIETLRTERQIQNRVERQAIERRLNNPPPRVSNPVTVR